MYGTFNRVYRVWLYERQESIKRNRCLKTLASLCCDRRKNDQTKSRTYSFRTELSIKQCVFRLGSQGWKVKRLLYWGQLRLRQANTVGFIESVGKNWPFQSLELGLFNILNVFLWKKFGGEVFIHNLGFFNLSYNQNFFYRY